MIAREEMNESSGSGNTHYWCNANFFGICSEESIGRRLRTREKERKTFILSLSRSLFSIFFSRRDATE